jgi:CrcB protein
VVNEAFLVFVGGGVGSALRYAVARGAAELLQSGFPWGTVFVNVAGSLAAGLLIGLLGARAGAEPGTAHLLLMTGFLGGFTTFSAFSMDALALASRQPVIAAGYVIGTVTLSLGAALIGLWLARGGPSPL